LGKGMISSPGKVVIVGGGLAGLAAGIRLLEQRPDTEVTLYTLGHHLGGKATSYKDDAGFAIDHGFHSISTNYRRFLDLLSRSGVDKSRTLVLDRGTYYYDDRTQKVAQSGAATDAQSREENGQLAAFFLKNLSTIYRDENIEQYDDICWTAWAVEHGLAESVTRTRSFRFSQDALFNWPHEVSAYITLKSIRLLGGSARYYLVDGTYGEDLIDPIINRFRKLGGTVKMGTQRPDLAGPRADGRRVRAGGLGRSGGLPARAERGRHRFLAGVSGDRALTDGGHTVVPGLDRTKRTR
jgi:uncharacterized protein with NAD-binding domain and iron-sulfur cluster